MHRKYWFSFIWPTCRQLNAAQNRQGLTILAMLFFVTQFSYAAKTQSTANDNLQLMRPCQLLLVAEEAKHVLSEGDGQVLYDAGKANEIISLGVKIKQLLKTGVGTKDPLYSMMFDRQWDLMRNPPYVKVAPNGKVFVVDDKEGRMNLTIYDPISGRIEHSIEIQPNVWLGHLGQISSTGRYFVTESDGQRQIRIVSSATGTSTSIESTARPGEEFFGVDAEFTENDRFLTINRNGFVEILESSGDKFTSIKSYELGSSAAPIDEAVPMFVTNAISSVQYISQLNSVVAFYGDAEPLILKLKPQGQFDRLFLQEAQTEFPPLTVETEKVPRAPGLTDYLARPNYKMKGYLSPAGDKVFAIRSQVAPSYELSAIDVFSTHDRRFLGSISVPHSIANLAISPDGQRVAVSFHDGVNVYDLGRSFVKPLASIKIHLFEASLLGFPQGNVIVCGSANVARVYKFTIKED